jgi:hypothetical protein
VDVVLAQHGGKVPDTIPKPLLPPTSCRAAAQGDVLELSARICDVLTLLDCRYSYADSTPWRRLSDTFRCPELSGRRDIVTETREVTMARADSLRREIANLEGKGSGLVMDLAAHQETARKATAAAHKKITEAERAKYD